MTSHRAPQHRGAYGGDAPVPAGLGQEIAREAGRTMARGLETMGRALNDPFAVPATRQAADYDEPNAIIRQGTLTAAERFWYVLGCIGFGAMYFAKVPVKKALAEAGLAEMTPAEKFWYVLMCISFGAGYFAKLPVKKALSELLV